MPSFTVTYVVLAGPTAGQTFTFTQKTNKRKEPTRAEIAEVRKFAISEGAIPAISDNLSDGIRKIMLSGKGIGLAGTRNASEFFEIVHDVDEACTPLYRETVAMNVATKAKLAAKKTNI